MKVSELGNLKELVGGGPLAGSFLWRRDVESIHPAEVQCFLRLREARGCGDQARQNVEALLSELRTCVARGEVRGALIERLSAPSAFTLRDFEEALAMMSPARQAAVRFAWLTDIDLMTAATIRWSEALVLVRGKPYARQLLDTQPRHIRTDRVFWEVIGRQATPLFSLPSHFEVVTGGVTWAAAMEMLRHVPRVDFHFDEPLFTLATRECFGNIGL